jgi:hypothetical protein
MRSAALAASRVSSRLRYALFPSLGVIHRLAPTLTRLWRPRRPAEPPDGRNSLILGKLEMSVNSILSRTVERIRPFTSMRYTLAPVLR